MNGSFSGMKDRNRAKGENSCNRLSQYAGYGIHGPIHTLPRRLPVANAHTHSPAPAPRGPTKECFARCANPRDHFVSPALVLGGPPAPPPTARNAPAGA